MELTGLPQTLTASSYIVASVVTLLAGYLASVATYRLFFSPLSNIPGPWFAAVSDFSLTTHVARLQQCMVVDTLFKKYGPIVRIGPNRVAFKDMAGVKNVYSVYKFDKAPSYLKMRSTDDADQAMTFLDAAAHGARRKTWGSHYTVGHLAKFQPDMQDAAHQLIEATASFGGKRPIDCLVLFRHFTIEIIMATMYGCRLNALKSWSAGVEVPICEAIGHFPLAITLRGAVPDWLWKLACRIPHRGWQKICSSGNANLEFTRKHLKDLRQVVDSGKDVDDEKIPMVLRLLRYRDPATGLPALQDKDIVAEVLGHTIAGTDTTAITLSYFCWELGRQPDIVKKLRAELDGVMHDSMDVPDIATLQTLPYLNAFLKEGLRIYGAAPSLLERETPSEKEPFSIAGYTIPAHTIVAAQAWSLGRDLAVFHEPESSTQSAG
ncbi:cytochrome P450 [Schizophyllum commune H4-8]|uniref:cytochrome P450 n=1 Tax=Schizophyllum commune (strain H4-8 / FGSC 9210) TaxID=578458 RepID=UPI00215ECCB9|nr:cytochrome P450 [Schizophyllum commune H4-8]KAI5893316.1 cytochrome P450 [Schizophyllum commune H4-8]